MPHITLQYRDAGENVPEIRDLFLQLHKMLYRTAGIESELCKSRVIPINDHLIGDGLRDQNFAHLELRLLEGRSPELKEQIGAAALDLLKRFFRAGGQHQIQISVELIDMQKSHYYKFPPLS